MFTEPKTEQTPSQTPFVVKTLPGDDKKDYREVSLRLICGTVQQCDSVEGQINRQLKHNKLFAGQPTVDRTGRDKRITFKVTPGGESDVEQMITDALVSNGRYRPAQVVNVR